MPLSQRQYTFTVYGATGFTGERVCQYLDSKLRDGNIKWAIAGRSLSKLETIAAKFTIKPDILNADVSDQDALFSMASQSMILINCVGPFRKFGEPVVKACLDAKTHYVDVTGEPEFMEMMEFKYHDKAVEENVLIVSACGFDSIPADLGVYFTTTEMQKMGTISTIQSFLQVSCGEAGFAGHYGTWESAVLGFGNADKLRELRKEVKAKENIKVPRVGKPLTISKIPTFSDLVQKWTLPFPGADASVVSRTNKTLFKSGKRTELPMYFAMFSLSSTFSMVSTVIGGTIFGMFALFQQGRDMLMRYPGFFSMGLFSHEGPTEEQMRSSSFSFRFFAKGFTKGNTNFEGEPDLSMETRVSGPEPGYVATPIFVVESAFTLLEEYDSLEFKGGVLTPGAVFGKSGLIDRLRSNGIEFAIVDQ